MRTAGVILVLLGVTSFVFPYFHYRSMIMSQFGRHEHLAAGIAIGLGAVLVLLSLRREKATSADAPP